jgi:uncharacterized protein (TIGR00725 family)
VNGKIVIGVMGPGEGARAEDVNAAYELGQQIAQRQWTTLCGGRNCGVMEAVCRGAKSADGFTVGILPSDSYENASLSLDLAIPTDLGNARNNINILASTLIVACGMGAGTASEVALALKAKKLVILLESTVEAKAFFRSLDRERVFVASSVREAIEQIEKIIN